MDAVSCHELVLEMFVNPANVLTYIIPRSQFDLSLVFTFCLGLSMSCVFFSYLPPPPPVDHRLEPAGLTILEFILSIEVRFSLLVPKMLKLGK
jgi:hypothetical protein